MKIFIIINWLLIGHFLSYFNFWETQRLYSDLGWDSRLKKVESKFSGFSYPRGSFVPPRFKDADEMLRNGTMTA